MSVKIPTNPKDTFQKAGKRDQMLFYKGLDGKEYRDSAELMHANELWLKSNFKYKSKDGKEYSTMEEVQTANEEWMREHFKYKAMNGKEYSTMEEVIQANKQYMAVMFAEIKKEFDK